MMSQPLNIFIRVCWLCQWDAGWGMPGGPAIALRYALLGKVLVHKYYAAAVETMGDAISAHGELMRHSWRKGTMCKNNPTMKCCISGKQRGILWNSSDLAGKTQWEGSWKRQQRSLRNWGLEMVTTMAHQMAAQVIEKWRGVAQW